MTINSGSESKQHPAVYALALIIALLLMAVISISTDSDCPTGYVGIAGNLELRVPAFCAATYEMKQDEGRATSVPEGEPWKTVTRDQATLLCSNIGPEYFLLSNQEWQAIAREIESVAANWSGGEVGTGAINIGNFSTEFGAAMLESPCHTVGFPPRFSECRNPKSSDFSRKRTHTLRSGEEIWDIGGNAGEWVSSSVSSEIPGNFRGRPCATAGIYKRSFGPSGDYANRCDNSNSDGFGYVEGSGGTVIIRGGGSGMEGSAWNTAPGIFYANTNAFWDRTKVGPGFRCGYRP